MWRGHLCLPRRDSSRRLRIGTGTPGAETSLGAADTSVRATSKLEGMTTIRLAGALCLAAALYAQQPNETNTPSHPPRPPDFADVRYGPNVRNDLDIYLARSDKPTPLVLYFFPGGFVVGNKNTVPVVLLDTCKTAGITVAACNYRYATDSPLPACFHDAARALQFLRLHAAENNIDPRAVASTGS